ncbi:MULTISPECIES: phosphoribosylamine--glycine ligase [Kribbella]|uniref:Phosphoribosylamine--glycine ligase n=1 Tax=Kribbella pratensis TaxID=2512112 RepID=A0ABY2FCX8_9ACTN|nr:MULTISPECIES: phosphoribosylamine--glycine ligase [Kribbella]TDW81229.1 phosphoribosylamine--glycine ligase [Kribbella sp. VKM Ac-2566]TDW89225.1 phosphoribosylamine--glycine ligase [Kribbella pratensis]
MKVLVIGSGGREHALAWALAQDSEVEQVVAAPGNPGIAVLRPAYDGQTIVCRPVDISDHDAVVALARELDVDLVVVGPEAPLVAGLADPLRDAGFAVFGPSREAAQIEGSKAFAKDVMAAASVPTGRAYVCTTPEEAATAIDAFGPPYVVKDDGLAAGKGVVVTSDREAALAHAAECDQVLIEEFLDGPEVSLFAITDGTTVLPMQPAQDFKRLGDNDEGPNTGGMGAYTPLPWAPDDLVADITEHVLQPTIDELRHRGTPFSGLLYAGLALTSRGVRVIEFNCRFGDPETQALLPMLKTPLGGLLYAAATGKLADHGALSWRNASSVAVVVAAKKYPASPRKGDAITGVEQAENDDVRVFHAGTALNDEELVTAGGRVLAVSAVGKDLAEARQRAYAAVGQIRIKGSQHRTDIALKAERGEITV